MREKGGERREAKPTATEWIYYHKHEWGDRAVTQQEKRNEGLSNLQVLARTERYCPLSCLDDFLQLVK